MPILSVSWFAAMEKAATVVLAHYRPAIPDCSEMRAIREKTFARCAVTERQLRRVALCIGRRHLSQAKATHDYRRR